MKNVLSFQEAFVKNYHQFVATLAQIQKNVTIKIGEQDLQILKQNNYKLCFAKKVGDKDYNVVWQSYDNYLSNNTFSWTPLYQVFGSNIFQDNVQVSVSTNPVDIFLGQTCKLDTSGYINPPFTGGPDISFTVDNEYGPIHLGVNQISTGINGKRITTPIYVAENKSVEGVTTLTPVEKILVWFEQDIQTSTMFSVSRSKAVEIDLTTINTATREYTGGKWITPG